MVVYPVYPVDFQALRALIGGAAHDPPLRSALLRLGPQRAVQWRVHRGANAGGKSLGVTIPVATAQMNIDEPKDPMELQR